MKFSDISTERALDVLCELTVPVSSIVTDEALMDELRSVISPEQASTKAEMMALGMEKLGKLMPIIFRSHREDVYAILAIINDQSAEEIARQNVLVTMCRIREIIKDKELLDFFKSCADTQGIE